MANCHKNMQYKKIISLIVPAILLSSCTIFTNPFQKQNLTTSSKQEGGNALASIKNAISIGASTKCSYKGPDGEVSTLIKGNKMKIDGIDFSAGKTKGEKGGIINDGEWIYFWGGEEKEGFKYKISDLDDASSKEFAKSIEDMKDPKKWAESVDGKYQVKCDPTVVNDSQFTPPADITFQDFSQLFKDLKGLAPVEGQNGTNPATENSVPNIDQKSLDTFLNNSQESQDQGEENAAQ